MAYTEEEKSQIKRQLSKKAISLAMQGLWNEAVAVNKELLAISPNDIDALNRLGKAYMEMGDYQQAKEAYEKALMLDRYNGIAQKNLQRLSLLVDRSVNGINNNMVNPEAFIEEAGKAGMVSLINLAKPEVLAPVVAGDQVFLKIEGEKLIVINSQGNYLGQVDAKTAQRLIKLMVGGNRYAAAVTSSAENKMTVIIREIYQDPSQVGQRSFPASRMEELRAYASDRLIHKELEEEYNEDLGEEDEYESQSDPESSLKDSAGDDILGGEEGV